MVWEGVGIYVLYPADATTIHTHAYICTVGSRHETFTTVDIPTVEGIILTIPSSKIFGIVRL